MVPQALANWRPTVAFTGQTGYTVSALSAPSGPTAYSHGNSSSLRSDFAAAIGRLLAPELRLPVRLYDMDGHYQAVKDKWISFSGGLKN